MNHSIIYPVIRAQTNVNPARCESPSGLVFLGVPTSFYLPAAPSQLTVLYVQCCFFSLGSLRVFYCWPCTHAPSALLQRSLHRSPVRDFIPLSQLSDHRGLSTLAVSAVWDPCPSLVPWLTLSFWKTLLPDTPTSKNRKGGLRLCSNGTLCCYLGVYLTAIDPLSTAFSQGSGMTEEEG